MGDENLDDEESPCGWCYRTIAVVELDNKHEFVRLMNRVSSDYKETVILHICLHDAADCFGAILDGEVGDESLAIYLPKVVGNMPLHYAAIGGSNPRITLLLLDKGFSPDLRTDVDYPPFCLKNALPLNISLDYYRYGIWAADMLGKVEHWKSPTYQIIKFCDMSSCRAITRAIARKTTEIKHEFFKYLKQGMVFEVGALLAIASDLIMSPSSAIDGANGSIGFKNIMEMQQFLLAEMSRSLGASETQLKEMKKTLRLLEIFDRIGDKLVLHMPMWDKDPYVAGFKVGGLIESAAYDEEVEVEYEYDAVPSAYYPPYPFPSCNEYETTDDETTSRLSSPDVPNTIIYPSHWQKFDCMRKFSTKIHFPRVHSPSLLKERSSHDNAPLPLTTTLKGAVTKHVLSEKHAFFTGAFAKSLRRLRYR